MSASLSRLTGSRILARNSLLNLAGAALPMLAALVSIPILIAQMGEERFGVLALAWVLIGYFSLFDLGFGRALTKLVAEKLGAGEHDGLSGLVWTAASLMFLLGAVGGAVLALVASPLVRGVLKIPEALQGEALGALYLMALSLPWVIGASGFQGILEANQSFGVINALRVPLGLFSYLAPLLVLPFSSSLVPVVALLAAGRVLGWTGYLVACMRVLPMLRRRPALEWGHAWALARFGGWITVSNAVSPLMTYLDRFLIGALISIAAVAYYVTPYELATKLWLVPTAVLGVLFPAFAATFTHDRERTTLLFDRGVRAILLVMFPVVLAIITLAHEGMELWLGGDFAARSAPVLQWLALGVFINCLGQVPFALIQGVGRPDITGKLHLAELPLYAVMIWGMSRWFGIQGVAIAWVLRVTFDTAVLFVVAERLVPTGSVLLRRTLLQVLTAFGVFALSVLLEGIGAKVTFLAGGLLLFGLVAWGRILSPTERAFLQRRYVLDR